MHRWTGSGDAPWDYIELQLCRDVYHCLPSELDAEEWDRISRHLDMMDVEAKTEHKLNRGR